MKICFPTAACGALDFSASAVLASRLGFDGVELHAFSDPSVASATNALLTSTDKINRIFSGENITISSLNVGSAGSELVNRISLAAEFNCPAVRFECDELLSRSQKTSARAVDFARHCADLAAAHQIALLLENQPIRGSAITLWHLLDRINHPAVACCWNTFSALVAGDSPAVAVPTLNSRIQCVLLQDGKKAQPFGLPLNLDLGTGDVPARKTLDRLRGIGFQNSLIVSPPNAASIEVLEQSLEKSLGTLRQWNILPAPVASA
jgi:sugar phosphate isomerase/epimerase